MSKLSGLCGHFASIKMSLSLSASLKAFTSKIVGCCFKPPAGQEPRGRVGHPFTLSTKSPYGASLHHLAVQQYVGIHQQSQNPNQTKMCFPTSPMRVKDASEGNRGCTSGIRWTTLNIGVSFLHCWDRQAKMQEEEFLKYCLLNSHTGTCTGNNEIDIACAQSNSHSITRKGSNLKHAKAEETGDWGREEPDAPSFSSRPGQYIQPQTRTPVRTFARKLTCWR